MIKYFALAVALLTGPAFAQQEAPLVEKEKLLVLGCLESMEAGSTTWPQCLELMFQPCVAETPGTPAHEACLTGLRQEWAGTVETLRVEVMEAVTAQGGVEVVDLMGLWNGYVAQKCQEVAASKPDGPESARIGCEVTELVGLSGEFAACLEGRSAAEYCKLKGS